MRAALTFDDGPSARWTPLILDLLNSHAAKATFFVCGQHADHHPEIVLRMHEEGHTVGNHTYTHPRLSTLDARQTHWELDEAQEAIGRICAFPTLWRAPYGDCPDRAIRVGADLGLRHVGWTIDPGDWNQDDPARIADAVISGLFDGAIIDLHDGLPPNGGSGTRSRQPTVDALAVILSEPDVEWVAVEEL